MTARRIPARYHAAVMIVLILACLAAGYNARRLYLAFTGGFASDFAINWTAAQGVTRGLSRYDTDGLHALGVSLIGEPMEGAFGEFFFSYIGPPSTVLFYLPFTTVSFSRAVILYRLAVVLAFVAAIGMAAWALPVEDRRRGRWIGLLAFMTLGSVVTSIGLGQVDGFVVLALAVSFWATSRNRQWLAGAGAGVAALLKISPGLLIPYFLLRGQWKAFVAALSAVLVVTGAALLVGQPKDLGIFAREIVPSLAAGSLHPQNQSLPAVAARLFIRVPAEAAGDYATGIGAFRWLAPIAGIAGLIGVCAIRRARSMLPVECGLIVIVGLLAGPITWDHYASWAIASLVLLVDSRLWETLSPQRSMAVIALLILGWASLVPPTGMALPWISQATTVTTTVGLLLWFSAALFLVFHSATSPEMATAGPDV